MNLAFVRSVEYKATERTPLYHERTEVMAFAIHNLSVHGYSNGFTLWHYRSEVDKLAEIDAAGYFNSGADMFTAGDMILISAADGGAHRFVAAVDLDHVSIVPLS